MTKLAQQIWTAAANRDMTALALLLPEAKPHDFNYESKLEGGGSNYTALMIATHFGDTQMITHIVNAGADINYRDSSSNLGWSALIVGAKMGQSVAVKTLTDLGADPNVKNTDGNTALLMAALCKQVEVVKVLLEAGADKTIRNKRGKTAEEYTDSQEIKNLIRSIVPLPKPAATAKTPNKDVSTPVPTTTASAQMPASGTTNQTGQAQNAQSNTTSANALLDRKVVAAIMAEVLQRGCKPWWRSKLSLLGQGRAGKTATANAIIGKTFEETASTVGINQLTCDVKHIKAGAGEAGACGEQVWGECEKPQREYEGAVAASVAVAQRRDGPAAPAAGSDIRTHIPTKTTVTHTVGADVQKTPSTTPSLAPAVKTATDATDTIISKPQPQPPVEEETVMKELAKLQDTSTGLLISLFDFGGQAVFDVIHHLFLTRNGVYALMFNMEWLVSDGPDKVTALSFMRKWLSSITAHTLREGRTAPIVIVGTRLDTISDPAVHERISTILYDELHDSLAWPSVTKNDSGKDRNGRAEQVFFPVDNKLGKKGASMQRLMSVVYGAMDKAEYTHKEVPLTWFKAIDQMSDTKKDCLPLTEVVSILSGCGVSEEEVPLLLSFLHDMGHLMWLDEPGLRDVVILDPVSYLVTPATIIICKLAPDSVDSVYHHMEVHAECQVKHRWEFDELVSKGVLSVKLLPILWKEYQPHSAMLLQLMVKFGLLVPLRNPTAGAGAGAVPLQYLVPSLLSPAPLADPDIVNWTDKSSSSCYFVFTLIEQLEQSVTLTTADLAKSGFLPGGMFERLVGKALSWCQDTARGTTVTIDSVMLHKDLVILSFGRQRFRLVHCADIHCVRVDVEGSNPVGIQQKLLDFIRSIVQECMGSLFCFPAVLFETETAKDQARVIFKGLKDSDMLIPLERLRAAVTGGSMLTRRGGRTLLTVEEVKAKYGQWLQLRELRERYDAFISYRWGDHDSKFTEQLFDMFTNYSVGAQSRSIQVFVDRKRLQEGRLFKADFAAALTHSLIALPVVSVDALQRMQDHNASTVDNVLLEWVMLLESHRAGRLLKVYPVLFGARTKAILSGEDSVSDFFAHSAKDQLPKVTPSATLAQAAELLRANGIQPSEKMQSYTVHSVVQELLQFLLCKASDFPGSILVESFAERVVQLLGECGNAALDGVEGRPPGGGTVGSIAAGTSSSAAATTGVGNHSIAPVAQLGAHVPSVTATPNTASEGRLALKDLTIAQVGQLLVQHDLDDLQPIFAANKVKGARLALCEKYEELMGPKVGVTDALQAKELMQLIVEWQERGVPAL